MKTVWQNGVLNPQFTNQNYTKGTGAGVKCVRTNKSGRSVEDRLVAINSGNFLMKYSGAGNLQDCNIEIPKFSINDIEKGELCWFSDDGEDWKIGVFESFDITDDLQKMEMFNTSSIDGDFCYYCVPLIMASTPQEATERREWHVEID